MRDSKDQMELEIIGSIRYDRQSVVLHGEDVINCDMFKQI